MRLIDHYLNPSQGYKPHYSSDHAVYIQNFKGPGQNANLVEGSKDGLELRNVSQEDQTGGCRDI